MPKYKLIEREVEAVPTQDGHYQVEFGNGQIIFLEKTAFELMFMQLTPGKPRFEDGLIYAADQRCQCGQGMAYREQNGMQPMDDTWRCSGILRGDAIGENHYNWPMAFYPVMPEISPRVCGRTTRPTPEAKANTP